MGCGSSKSGETRGRTHASSPAQRFPVLDTPEQQSARFLELCRRPPPPSSASKASPMSRHDTSAGPSPAGPNPLAVELLRVYTETRHRVLEQQLGDEEATALRRQREREALLLRAHGRVLTAPATGAANKTTAAAAAGNNNIGASSAATPVLPPALQEPAQREFALCINESVAEAYRRGFTAYDVVEAVELFVGFVKHDLRTQQEDACRANSSRRGSLGHHPPPQSHTHKQPAASAGSAATGHGHALRPAADLMSPSVPWTCRMQCTLSGQSPLAESLLEAGRLRWRHEREASRVTSTQPGQKPTAPTSTHEKGTAKKANKKTKHEKHEHKSKTASTTRTVEKEALAQVGEPVLSEGGEKGTAVTGGKGMLFIDAVFESTVPGSFDRRTPWQLEINMYFAA